MKVALLGSNEDLLLLAGVARAADNEISWVGDVRPADRDAIRELAPALTDRKAEWELLLDGAVADAVIVGTGTAGAELRAEQLKRLVAAGVPILVVQPVFTSVLPYYELDMTRRETHCLVRHFNPLMERSIVADLRGWVQSGHPAVGSIHQVSCERWLNNNTKEEVLCHLARDVELLAAVCGDIRRVTAIGPRPGKGSYAALQVQMSANGPASLRWSVRPAASERSGLVLSLIGENGSATLQIDDIWAAGETVAGKLETHVKGNVQQHPLAAINPANEAIREFAAAVAETGTLARSSQSTWDSATRAMETVDAIELSLEKDRSINVYQQQLTERLAFRGTMAAMGCGLLLVGFMAIVLVTILGSAEHDGRAPLVPGWPTVLLAVLAFFLLLQAVPLLAHRSKQSTAEKETADRPDARS